MSHKRMCTTLVFSQEVFMEELLACYQYGLLYLGAIAGTQAEQEHDEGACTPYPATAAREDGRPPAASIPAAA